MNDAEIDAYISKRISDLDLELGDFITGRADIYRILTEGEFHELQPYSNLAVPVKDLVAYWWNNIADHDGFIDVVLDDILTVYKDRLLPEREEEYFDVTDAMDKVAEAL